MRVLSGVFVLVLLCGSPGDGPGGQLGRQGWRQSGDAQLRQDPGPEFKYRIGLVAGGFFTWPIGAHLDVQPEVLFSQQGASFDAPGLESVTIKLDSLVVPDSGALQAELVGQGAGGLRWTVARLQTERECDREVERRQSTTDDISDDIESFDYGVVFGAGWEAGRFTHRRPLHVGSQRARQGSRTTRRRSNAPRHRECWRASGS